jgi:hypothetical protein
VRPCLEVRKWTRLASDWDSSLWQLVNVNEGSGQFIMSLLAKSAPLAQEYHHEEEEYVAQACAGLPARVDV